MKLWCFVNRLNMWGRRVLDRDAHAPVASQVFSLYRSFIDNKVIDMTPTIRPLFPSDYEGSLDLMKRFYTYSGD